MISIHSIQEARSRISSYIVNTPLVRSNLPDFSMPNPIYLKLETQQPTGSFKVRPAFNGMLVNLNAAKTSGVVASSSGNYAQAVAYAAKTLGVDAKIVMPSNTSPYKIERTKYFSSCSDTVVICGPSFKERWDTTFQLQKETGRVLLHPYDSDETIAGDGTLALELLDQLEGDFAVVVPTSGGGLLSGIALTLKTLRPGCKVFGVQTAENGSMRKSLDAGMPFEVGSFTTLADSLVCAKPGDKTFEIIKKHVDGFVLVKDADLGAAMKFLATEQKLVAEPGAVTGIVALQQGLIGLPKGMPVVCVLSGANVLWSKFKELTI